MFGSFALSLFNVDLWAFSFPLAFALIPVAASFAILRERLYDIDRLDVTVRSTFDADLQDTVTSLLQRLGDPAYAKSVKLRESRLLANGDPAAVLYSFTLYERVEDANLVRVQTDNFSQPFDINEGAKLELGSTAKLRALATYLDVVASLHERYAALNRDAARELQVGRRDRLTRWAIDYLANAKDPSLRRC
jgi:membrane peptidoglycan carboxypeptidase